MVSIDVSSDVAFDTSVLAASTCRLRVTTSASAAIRVCCALDAMLATSLRRRWLSASSSCCSAMRVGCRGPSVAAELPSDAPVVAICCFRSPTMRLARTAGELAEPRAWSALISSSRAAASARAASAAANCWLALVRRSDAIGALLPRIRPLARRNAWILASSSRSSSLSCVSSWRSQVDAISRPVEILARWSSSRALISALAMVRATSGSEDR